MSRRQDSSPRTSALAGLVLLVAQTASALSDPQSPPGSANDARGTDFRYGADYNGLDITRPEKAYVEMRLEDRTSGIARSVDAQALLLRGGGAVALSAGWKFAWLSEIALINETTVTSAPPGSSGEFGIGDTVFQGVLSRPIDERWGYRFGARLVAPTAGRTLSAPDGGRSCPDLASATPSSSSATIPTSFRSCAMQSALAATRPGAIAMSRKLRRRSIRLPDRWFVTFYPSYDIRINYGDPVPGQTGRLFLPFDAAIGRKITDKAMITWESAAPIVKDYPVYNFKTELRLTINF